MSDARRVSTYIETSGRGGEYIDDSPHGTHALLPWEEYEGLRATELAHASTITELSLKVGDLRLDAENGWTARDHWKKKCEAKEAVVEAARDARSEYFTAYPTEGELLKRMQALDAALRKLRE